jgi:hypothetical protein
MPTLAIASAKILNQSSAEATFFHPFLDTLTMKVDLVVSAEFATLPEPRYVVQFQIINLTTDTVVVNHFKKGKVLNTSFSVLSDSQSPNAWGIHPAGLNWNEVFGFRTIAKAYSFEGEDGEKDLDAFSVSEVRWFRVGRTFTA